MKVQYFDTEKNYDIYLEDNPYCKIRVVFTDGGNTYIYYSDDLTCQMYINRIINVNKKPHMFFASNLEVIENDEQFDSYYTYLNNNSNFQAMHQDDAIDGSDNTSLILPNGIKLL